MPPLRWASSARSWPSIFAYRLDKLQTGWTGVIARIMQLFAAPEIEQAVGRKTTAQNNSAANANAARR